MILIQGADDEAEDDLDELGHPSVTGQIARVEVDIAHGAA